MPSTTRGRTRYRCGRRHCRTRFAVKNRAKRPPKCPACGEKVHVRNIEAERRRELQRQQRCYCNAYPFPHRAGSLRMCSEHSLAGTEPTAEEIEDYYGCLETPRSNYC